MNMEHVHVDVHWSVDQLVKSETRTLDFVRSISFKTSRSFFNGYKYYTHTHSCT